MPARWSVTEDQVLRRSYAAGTPLRTIAEQLGRSADAVSERRRTLHIEPRPRQRPWLGWEDELLRVGSTLGLPATAIAEQLHRPPEQVRRRRRTLVATKRAVPRFTAADDAQIAARWADGGDIEALAHRLGRTPGSVRLRGKRLGLHHPAARPRWQPDEDAAVRDGYERGQSCTQIAAGLARRTPTAVAARAAKLGLSTYARTWTAREDRALRRLSRDGMQLERAAQLLGRTPEALRARGRKLGVAPPHSRRAGQTARRWTPREDESLRLHSELNPAMLADLLDRSPEAITQRLRRLGLRQGAERSPHHPAPARGGLTPGQRLTVVRELRSGGPRRQLTLARRLGIPPATIRALRKQASR